MQNMMSTFITSIDDFITYEEHTCTWLYAKASHDDPEDLSLVSVDGMDQNICPPDLWKAALSEYPDNIKPLTEYDV